MRSHHSLSKLENLYQFLGWGCVYQFLVGGALRVCVCVCVCVRVCVCSRFLHLPQISITNVSILTERQNEHNLQYRINGSLTR